MSTNCSVYGCFNTPAKARKDGREIHFYSFSNRPWKKQQMQHWINFVGRKGRNGQPWIPTRNSRICSEHFIGNQRSEHPLHPSYNPTIHPVIPRMNFGNGRFDRTITRKRKSVETEDTTDNGLIDVELEDGKSEVGCQTEDLLVTHSAVQTDCHENKKQTAEKCVGPSNRTPVFCGYETVRNNEKQLRETTGVGHQVFSVLLTLLPERNNVIMLVPEDRLLLFLMKLKLGISYCVLGTLFGLVASTASKIFTITLSDIYHQTLDWIHWPSQEAVRLTNPPAFHSYPNCRAIIDCTEFKTDKPPTVEAQVKMYSSYKQSFTAKVLICITPAGLISFISKAYGGRASDPYITNNCGLLTKFEPGDVILADKGFPRVEVKEGTVVVTPPFSSKLHPQFTTEEMNETFKVASVRIHVERAI